jgi:hypothetical protein
MSALDHGAHAFPTKGRFVPTDRRRVRASRPHERANVAATYVPQALPDRQAFTTVAQLLDVRCGSLDCHGTLARNLRLFGSAGLRWSAGDRPLVPLCNTQDEADQDYESVVGLEPETMSAIVLAGGADPDRLTMVRKARGIEAHKGGQIWTEGDDSDTCLTSWLAGSANSNACAQGMASVLPGGSGNPLLQCVAP